MVNIVSIIRHLKREGCYSCFKKMQLLLRFILKHFKSTTFNSRMQFDKKYVGKTPLFTILLPCWRTRRNWLKAAVLSVQKQSFADWELIVGECELDKNVKMMLMKIAKNDPRIRIITIPVNCGISANTNILANEASGKYLAFLDHDDWLHRDALQEVSIVASTDESDIIYTDETRMLSAGLPLLIPSLKPEWALDSFLSSNYICHLMVIRTALFHKLGGLQSLYDGAQDWELLLRACEQTNKIRHISKVLYYWRNHSASTAWNMRKAKFYAEKSQVSSVQSFLDRNNISATASPGEIASTVAVRYTIVDLPPIDILMLSANKNNILRKNIEKLIASTSYGNYKVRVLLNNTNCSATDVCLNNSKVIVSKTDKPFNWSEMNNHLASESDAAYFVFLNDDIEVIDGNWLAALLEHSQRKGIGAVGGLLIYPNNKIQHSGLSLSQEYIACDYHQGYKESSYGYLSRLKTIQNVSAVTGACLATSKQVFLKLGGFDEKLPYAYNDVDYCCKVTTNNFRVVFTPYCKLIHHESYSRGYDTSIEKSARLQAEADYMRAKWGSKLAKELFLRPL